MAQLRLYLSDSPCMQLDKAIYINDWPAERILSVRGKTVGPYVNAKACFVWSAAVKSLVVFFIRAALKNINPLNSHDDGPLMIGTKGSLAHSLAIAMRKEPRWLTEMFGTDSSGVSNIKRIIYASNLYLNFGDKVSLGLNTKRLSYETIEVYLNDQKVGEESVLKNMINRLEEHFDSSIDPIVSEDPQISLGFDKSGIIDF